MAVKPQNVPKQVVSAENGQKILSAVYANASEQFKAGLPKVNWKDPATLTPDNLHTFGSTLLADSNKAWRNEFLDYILNRIARVYVSSTLYDNPWAFLKRGVLELGEFIEDIFVDLCDPHDYNPEVAEEQVLRREKPNVYATVYAMNYQKFYKQTIQTADLRQAFLSWEGISDLVAKISTAMYTSANYDEYVSTKWMLARLILDGRIRADKIPAVTNANMDEIAETLRSSSSDLTFMSTNYNRAHVHAYTDFDDQYLFISTAFEAKMDVQVLASAFNMSRADFLAKRVLVDGFGNLDIDRLTKLFGDSDGFTPPTKDELDALNQIPAILVDKDYIQIYDNLVEFGSIINPQGLYENMFLHVWKTFASSPYKNAKMFLPFTQTVDSVSVTPTSASVTAGQKMSFMATVMTTGFADKSVIWSVSGNASTSTTINSDGLLSVSTDETATSISVTVTSVADSAKSAVATVKVTTV